LTTGGAVRGVLFYLQGGKLSCLFGDSGSYSICNSAGPNLQDGQFHHVALTLDRDSVTGGKLYVDGSNVLTFNPTNHPGDSSNDNALRIGNHASSSLKCFFKGVIDELTLYCQALSSDEVQAIYNANCAGKCLVVLPAITDQPVGQKVVAGSNATSTAGAMGTQRIAVQVMIDSLSGGSGQERAQFNSIHRQANGKTRIDFTARRGRVYIVEISTDLVNWEKIGLAADKGNGQFEFEDAQSPRTPTRFYRVVSP